MKAYRAVINRNTVINHAIDRNIEKSADSVKYFSDIEDARAWVKAIAPNFVFAEENLSEEIYGSINEKDEMTTLLTGEDVQHFYSGNIAKIEIE